MKEHVFLFTILLGLLCIIPLASASTGYVADEGDADSRDIRAATEAATPVKWGPYITGTTMTEATVNWHSGMPAGGVVEYATETYFAAHGTYEHDIDDPSEAEHHRVTLTGLSPGTRYHYRVTVDGNATDDRTLSTFPESGPFTFIVYGDTQGEWHNLVAERIAEEDPLFVLHTGDLVNTVANQSQWDRFFVAGDPVFANTSIYTTPGNHEDNSSFYYNLFGMPEWYSFRCSGAHFTVLHSNIQNGSRMDDETAWLEADLVGEDGWKFVAFHHPPYSTDERNPGGRVDLRDAWGPIFAENRVSAVFSGHMHAYEHYRADGVNYVVTGTGGGPLYPLGSERPEGYRNSLQQTLGYTKVTVSDEGTATMEFVGVALVSRDNDEVLQVYPDGMSFNSFNLAVPDAC